MEIHPNQLSHRLKRKTMLNRKSPAARSRNLPAMGEKGRVRINPNRLCGRTCLGQLPKQTLLNPTSCLHLSHLPRKRNPSLSPSLNPSQAQQRNPKNRTPKVHSTICLASEKRRSQSPQSKKKTRMELAHSRTNTTGKWAKQPTKPSIACMRMKGSNRNPSKPWPMAPARQ